MLSPRNSICGTVVNSVGLKTLKTNQIRHLPELSITFGQYREKILSASENYDAISALLQNVWSPRFFQKSYVGARVLLNGGPIFTVRDSPSGSPLCAALQAVSELDPKEGGEQLQPREHLESCCTLSHTSCPSEKRQRWRQQWMESPSRPKNRDRLKLKPWIRTWEQQKRSGMPICCTNFTCFYLLLPFFFFLLGRLEISAGQADGSTEPYCKVITAKLW